MRIGLLITSIGDFGQKGFYNAQEVGLAKSLDKLAEEVNVYKLVALSQEKKTEPIEGCKNANVQFIPTAGFGSNGQLDIEILDKTLDVLIYFSDTQFAVPKVYKWAQKNGVKLLPYIGVIESHSTNKIKKIIVNWMFKRNLSVYRKCHCLVKTPAVKEQLEALRITNLTIVPVGLDLSLLKQDYLKQPVNELKSKYGFGSGDKILLFIGRLTEEKQPLKMLKIYGELLATDNAYRLIMVGKGPLKEEVEELIKKWELSEKVLLIDSIFNSDIWELYRMADTFINLNQQEIFGMAILEAMYYECKVVAWEAPGPEYIIENGVSGWLVKSEQEIIEKILNKKNVVQDAHERILAMFTWNVAAKILVQLM